MQPVEHGLEIEARPIRGQRQPAAARLDDTIVHAAEYIRRVYSLRSDSGDRDRYYDVNRLARQAKHAVPPFGVTVRRDVAANKASVPNHQAVRLHPRFFLAAD